MNRPAAVRPLSTVLFLLGYAVAVAAILRAFRLCLLHTKQIERWAGVDQRWLQIALALCLVALSAAAWRRFRQASAEGEDPWVQVRLLFETLVLGTVLFLAFVQPFDKLKLDVAFGLAMGGWAVALLVVGFARGNRVVRAAEVVAFNVCLFIVLAELGLRVAAGFSPSPLLEQTLDRPSSVIRQRREQQGPGHLRFGFPLSSRSFYDTEFRPGARRPAIAMIGDSFSYGVVPHYFHFSTVCERKSGAEVYNIGFPGIGPGEYLLLLEREALPLSPDLVAVNLFLGNDVSESKVVSFSHPKLRAWFDRRNLLIYQLPRRLAAMRRERAGASRGQPVGGIAGEDAEKRLDGVEEIMEAYPWVEDPSLEAATLLEETYLRVERERAEKVCHPARADFTALFSFVEKMRSAAGETPFVVQLIPDCFQVEGMLWEEIRRSSKVPGLDRDQPQKVIGRWLDQQGIPYLDLLPVLRKRCGPHGGLAPCYHLRDTHFNARGNRVAGEAMASFLARHWR